MRAAGRTVWLAMLLAAVLGAACGTEEEDAALGPASLKGGWFGPADDAGGTIGTLSAAFDRGGGISGSSTFGGAFTGMATYEGGQTFSFLLGDGTAGGFLTDRRAAHAAYLDEDFTFGVMERDAILLPFYYDTDLVGNWSGIGVETDFLTFTTAASTATVAADLTFNGSTGSAAFSGTFTVYSPTYGIYAFYGPGSFGRQIGQAYLTPDKRVLAAWSCLPAGVFPVECTFTVWTRQ